MPLRTPRARTYAEVVLADGSYAYWRLGEAGSTHFDSGPGRWTLSTTGAVSAGRFGALPNDLNSAIIFPGNIANYLETVTAFPSLSAFTSYTVEAWIQATAAGSYTCIYGGRPVGGAAGPFFGLNGAVANTLILYDTGHSPNEANGAINLVDSKWHHAAVVYDGVNAIFYVDGRQDTLTAATSTGGPAACNPRIGADSAGGNSGVTGSVQDVAFYTKALTATQILAHYRAGVAPAWMMPVGRNLIAAAATAVPQIVYGYGSN